MTNSHNLQTSSTEPSNIVAVLEVFHHSYDAYLQTLDPFSRAEERFFAARKQGADTQELSALRLAAEATKNEAFNLASKNLAMLVAAPARTSEEAHGKLQALIRWRDDDGLELSDEAVVEDRLAYSVLADFFNVMSGSVPLSVPHGSTLTLAQIS